MDRSLMLKAKALAKGTQRIDLSILKDELEPDDAPLQLPEPDLDTIDAEFVDHAEPVVSETALAVILPTRVTPGRARRATDAYAADSNDRRPVIAIG